MLHVILLVLHVGIRIRILANHTQDHHRRSRITKPTIFYHILKAAVLEAYLYFLEISIFLEILRVWVRHLGLGTWRRAILGHRLLAAGLGHLGLGTWRRAILGHRLLAAGLRQLGLGDTGELLYRRSDNPYLDVPSLFGEYEDMYMYICIYVAVCVYIYR